MDPDPDAGDARSTVEALKDLLGALVGFGASLGRSALGLLRLPRLKIGTDELNVVTHRDLGADAAIVLVHGFGVCERTWGDLPTLLEDEPLLEGWDLFSVGYDTGISPDVRGLWSADPDIATLATYLRSRLRMAPFARYSAVALVAHSMGGLVVQRALVDDHDLVRRCSHVLFYGTPSDGLGKARVGSFLKVQIRDMGTGSDFLADLRARWDAQFGTERPFELWTIAGDRDVFVPARSSLGPFPNDTHVVVPGNHLEICYAHQATDMGVRVLVDAIAGDAVPGGSFNAARVAVERREFHQAVELLEPHAADLDDRHLVELALALDEIGRREDAVQVLRDHATTTDALGTLAGRLKRVWMAEGLRREADDALKLYTEGYEAAKETGDEAQAAYHAINRAFLELLYRDDLQAARGLAQEVLEHCAASPPTKWSAASEAEARLYLGDTEAALDSYRRAVARHPSPRELAAMCSQATWISAAIGDSNLQDQLDELFGKAPASDTAFAAAVGHPGPPG